MLVFIIPIGNEEVHAEFRKGDDDDDDDDEEEEEEGRKIEIVMVGVVVVVVVLLLLLVVKSPTSDTIEINGLSFNMNNQNAGKCLRKKLKYVRIQ